MYPSEQIWLPLEKIEKNPLRVDYEQSSNQFSDLGVLLLTIFQIWNFYISQFGNLATYKFENLATQKFHNLKIVIFII